MKPLLILFVHGLGATSENAWGQFRRLIDEDDSLGPLADVRFFGFKTAKTRWSLRPSSRKQKVSDLAKGLRTEIDERYRDYASIVLVGHSMGGLVIRQYLVSEVRHGSPLRVNKAVLFAVPNQGSEMAAVANLFSVVHAQLADLTPDSPFLESLNGDWRAFGLDALIDVTHVIAGLDEAVREQSAVGLWGLAKVKLVADKSHSELVGVADSTDLAFLILRNAVLDFARSVGLSPVPASPSPRLAPPRLTPGPLPAWSQVLPPAPAIIPAAQAEPPTGFASQLSFFLAGRSPAALIESVEAKPRIEELFGVITDSEDVAAALFGMERNLPLAPYDVEYVNVREGVGDVQQMLDTRLRETKGRLLLCGPRGIGKTREVAELARAASATKWSVLVARTDGDARMGPVLKLPAALADARLLIVIDNLHTRILATANQPGPPYVERLHRLLESLERVLPGAVRVIATARDEPRFQRALQLTNGHDAWHTFGVYRLPKLTDDSLRQILTTLAARAQVAVAPDVVPKLIENSDRKPETIFINVDLARRTKTALSPAVWKPTEGESWRLRFVTARAEQAGVDAVGQTIHLLIKFGLPARMPYVIHVATAAGERHAREAIDSLVGEGLLRLRQGVLTPFSPEQLEELVGQGRTPPSKLADHAYAIEAAVVDSNGHPERIDDLLALALALERNGSQDRAEAVATRAVTLDPGKPRACRIRSAIRFGRADFTGAEADLSTALETGGDDLDTRLLRACIRNLLCNHTGALDDLEVVVREGRDDAVVQAQRSTALFQLGRWSEAEAAMTAEIDHGGAMGRVFFTRGIVRVQLNRLAEAEQDFSDALSWDVDVKVLALQIQQLERGLSDDATSSTDEAPSVSDAMIYAMRGWIRLRLGRNAEAEEDLTTAIEKNAARELTSLASAMRTSTLPMVANAVRKLELPEMISEGALYHLRGLTRLNLGKLDEAAADFTGAIARGFADGEVYYGRGVAHLRMDQIAEAERDAGLAIVAKKGDVATFTLRGVARLGLKRFAGAEEDLDRAIALDPANVQLYSWRAGARLEQQKAEASESDLTIVLARQPDDARTLYVRGLVRFDLGRFAQAEEDLTAAVTRGNKDRVLFSVRGFARLAQNKLAEAADDAELAIDEGRGDMQAYSLRAAVGLMQGRYEEAESDLNAAIDRGRGDEWVFANRGTARYELERYADAEQDFTAAIDLGANNPDLIVQRARARLAQDKGAEAEQDIRRAMADGRDDAFVHFSLGRAHQQQRRYEEAEAEFSLTLARDDEPVFRRSRGYTRLLKGDAAGAVHDFDLVIAASTADSLTFYLRALARFIQGVNAEARADCDAALALSPKESAALALRALLSIREKDFEAAARDCDRLKAAAPESSHSLGCEGALRLARGQFDDALPGLRSAAEEDEQWRASFGLASLLAGRLHEAKDAYQQVAASSPPFQKLLALADLDFELRLHPDRASLDEIRSAVGIIRSSLAQHAGHPQAGFDVT
jgi:tetratricopeptide (TPR) repeat protein